MTSIFLVAMLVLPAGTFRAAPPPTADSTDRWTIHTDRRSSFVSDRTIRTWGVSVGRVWGQKEREVTLGYYWLSPGGLGVLNRGVQERAFENGHPTFLYTYPRYVMAGYWHHFLNTRRFKVGLPLEAGVGRALLRERTIAGVPTRLPVRGYALVPVQVGGTVEWKATRWVGVGLQGGYHWELRKHQPVTDLDGFYYRFRVILYLPLYHDFHAFVFRRKPLPSPFADPAPADLPD
jgi:hypothetical protein